MEHQKLRVTVLGSGTSTGVPLPTCSCKVCTSLDKRNRRLRSSIAVQMLQPDAKVSELPTVVIDTTTDFRYQALRAKLPRVDAVLYTHAHADHILGLDDLRPFNFASKKEIPVYADEQSGRQLITMFGYAFRHDENYQGGAPPKLTMNRLKAFQPVELFGYEILPLPLLHGRTTILGFRIGPFAYLTDCSDIPDETLERLNDLKFLIIDGLRNRAHRTHFTHQQAVGYIERLKPQKAYLTHISHEVDHDVGNAKLKELSSLDIELAYDELSFEV